MIKRILFLGAAALAMGAAIRMATAPAPAVAVADGGGIPAEAVPPPTVANARPRWQELWARPAPELRGMALASDGTSVAWVDRKGSVRRIEGDSGKALFQTGALPGVNRLVVAPTGMILAYSYLNPVKPVLRVLHPRWGEKHGATHSVEGALWNVSLSADGTQAVAGTGARFVYVVPLAAQQTPGIRLSLPPMKRWKSQGIADSLSVAVSGEPMALLGTLQENGVAAWSLDGTPRWRHDERETDRKFRVHLSADGSTAVAVSACGPRRANARIDVWDAPTGRLLWRESLDALHPRALVSADGRFIALSYARMSTYRTGDALEQKLALFDRKGHRLFSDKGSSLFSPELVALSADGSRLTVRDGASTLYTLDSRGHFISKLRLPVSPTTGIAPTIQETTTTPDGQYLLLQRGDGWISLFKAAS